MARTGSSTGPTRWRGAMPRPRRFAPRPKRCTRTSSEASHPTASSSRRAGPGRFAPVRRTAATIWEAAAGAHRAIAVCLPPGFRLEPVFHDVRSLAERSHRSSLITRTDRHDAIPLGGLVEDYSTQPPDEAGTSSGGRRRHLHQSLAAAIEDAVGSGAVVFVDEVQQANHMTVDFLASLLTLGSAPTATFVLCFRIDHPGDVANLDRLGPLCSQVIQLEGAGSPVHSRGLELTGPERTLLRLLELCETAAPLEVIARALGLGFASVSEAVDGLVNHGLAAVDPAGRVEMTGRVALPRQPGETDDARPMHLALADAVADAAGAGDTYRILAEARHRLAALPLADPEQTWACARRAADYLDGIGAHGDLVRLLEPCARLPAEAPLDLVVQLGRSQVRSGHPDASETLDGVVDAAQRIGDVALLARSVRALNETRAPQTMTEQRRRLTEQALEGLAEDPAHIDTRVQLLTDLANGFHLDDPPRAEQLGRSALELARSSGVGATTGRALTGLIQAIWRPDSVEERLKLSIEAQERAPRQRLRRNPGPGVDL